MDLRQTVNANQQFPHPISIPGNANQPFLLPFSHYLEADTQVLSLAGTVGNMETSAAGSVQQFSYPRGYLAASRDKGCLVLVNN